MLTHCKHFIHHSHCLSSWSNMRVFGVATGSLHREPAHKLHTKLQKQELSLWDSTSLCRTSCTGVTDLYIEVFADSVDSDSMKTSVCQITRGGSEDVRFLACLQVIPDLHTPWKTKHKLLQSNATLHLMLSVRWKRGIYRSKSNLVHITLPGFKYVYPAF